MNRAGAFVLQRTELFWGGVILRKITEEYHEMER